MSGSLKLQQYMMMMTPTRMKNSPEKSKTYPKNSTIRNRHMKHDTKITRKKNTFIKRGVRVISTQIIWCHLFYDVI
jgi:hypothetical protein